MYTGHDHSSQFTIALTGLKVKVRGQGRDSFLVYICGVVWQCVNKQASTNFNECGRDENGLCYNRVCNSLEIACEKLFLRHGMKICVI